MDELKIKRDEKGLTQAQVSEELGISRSFYGLIEKGMRHPTYGLALKIATFFDAKPEDIFFNIEGFRLKRTKNRPAGRKGA